LKAIHYNLVSKFQHRPQHFAHTPAAWKTLTQHFTLRSQEEHQKVSWICCYSFSNVLDFDLWTSLAQHNKKKSQVVGPGLRGGHYVGPRCSFHWPGKCFQAVYQQEVQDMMVLYLAWNALLLNYPTMKQWVTWNCQAYSTLCVCVCVCVCVCTCVCVRGLIRKYLDRCCETNKTKLTFRMD